MSLDIRNPEKIFSPSLIVFREKVRHNIDAMLQVAGGVHRLRPHCKTHKMAAVTKLQLAKGIEKHKAATVAEAEMLAHSGVQDIVLSYPVIGPNIERVLQFRKTYPDAELRVIADDAEAVKQLGAVMHQANINLDVLVDINPGRDRTGVPLGPQAAALYQVIASTPGLTAAGLHIYDGHFTQQDPSERRDVVQSLWNQVLDFREQLQRSGLEIPRIICGGTPTFPLFAEIDDPALELSPGTCVFHDAGYASRYSDLNRFQPAAFVFTRVVSRPTGNRLTLDVGTKAVASDPPMGERVVFPLLPDAIQVIHNEEHLVVETSNADSYRPGDWLLALPRHICPTSALHSSAVVLEDGEIVDEWKVTARDRCLRI